MLRTLAYLAAAVAVITLAACAPQQQVTGSNAAPEPMPEQNAASQIWADFSDEGIVWSDGQQACVARAPQMQPVCPRLPTPTGPVAWDVQGRAWAALPRQGLVTTLDGPPRSQVVGRAVAMSAQAVYREDGSALGYGGEPRVGVAGRPSAVLTERGIDYALVANQLVEVGNNAAMNSAGPYLYRTQSRWGNKAVASASLPTAVVSGQRYQLQASHQSRPWALLRDGAATTTATTTTEPRALGKVGGQLWGLAAPEHQGAVCHPTAACTPRLQPVQLLP